MTTAPEVTADETVPLRSALASMVPPGLLLALVYSLGGNWSIGQGFGGEGDTGWIDFHGKPIDRPPPVVDVHGEPAAWVFVVLVLVLVATAVRVSRTAGRAARTRALIGCAVATAFIAAVILVFTVLQMHLVEDAFAHGSTHPPLVGNVTITEHPMVRTG